MKNARLKQLELAVGREFWTRTDELAEDLEDLGLEVLEVNAEYIAAVDKEDDELEFILYLEYAGRTITVSRIRQW